LIGGFTLQSQNNKTLIEFIHKLKTNSKIDTKENDELMKALTVSICNRTMNCVRMALYQAFRDNNLILNYPDAVDLLFPKVQKMISDDEVYEENRKEFDKYINDLQKGENNGIV
jgi:hypothetical protein